MRKNKPLSARVNSCPVYKALQHRPFKRPVKRCPSTARTRFHRPSLPRWGLVHAGIVRTDALAVGEGHDSRLEVWVTCELRKQAVRRHQWTCGKERLGQGELEAE